VTTTRRSKTPSSRRPGRPTSSPNEAPDTGEQTHWKSLAEQARAEIEQWKALARKHEDRAKRNYEAASKAKEAESKAKSVEEQLSELRKAMADRDVADMQRNGRLAVTQVQAKLAEAGLSAADMTGLFDLIDPVALLKDGEPDEAAITKLAKSLVRVAGRTTPDRDQGRRGGDGPVDMNQLVRRSVGINS
jgi:hypothetical protein